MTAPLESVPVRVGEAPTAASRIFSWKPKLAHNNESKFWADGWELLTKWHHGPGEGRHCQQRARGVGRALTVACARKGCLGSEGNEHSHDEVFWSAVDDPRRRREAAISRFALPWTEADATSHSTQSVAVSVPRDYTTRCSPSQRHVTLTLHRINSDGS